MIKLLLGLNGKSVGGDFVQRTHSSAKGGVRLTSTVNTNCEATAAKAPG